MEKLTNLIQSLTLISLFLAVPALFKTGLKEADKVNNYRSIALVSYEKIEKVNVKNSPECSENDTCDDTDTCTDLENCTYKTLLAIAGKNKKWK